MHVASIVWWMFVWYRTAAQSPTKADLLFSSHDKATLIKEDKCISACAYSNNINIINQRRPWHIAIYALINIISLTFMFFVFALRFEQCNQIFNLTKNINTELW